MTAIRVMKARRWGLCLICMQPITVGQRIAKRGGTWQHIEHLIQPPEEDPA